MNEQIDRLAKREQEIEDAWQHLETCLEELMHAQSMGNAKRIRDCQRWVTEAKATYRGLCEEQQK